MRSKVYVTKEFEFESAHNLINYKGACENLHGHTYKLQVTVSGTICNEDESPENLSSDFMVMDFKELKRIVGGLVDNLDHSYLNNFFKNPTAELMAVSIFNHLSQRELPKDVKVESVKLWETSTSFAEYKGEVV